MRPRRLAPRRRPRTLAMPTETIDDKAITNMEIGNAIVTAFRASGPTKAPRKMPSTTVRRPLALTRNTMGNAVATNVAGTESRV